METKDSINIAEDFADDLGARYKYEGPNSGELFLMTLLLPKFEKAVEGQYLLTVNLDGLMGLPSSFVSGSFGKLSLDKGASLLLKHLQFISKNELRIEKIVAEIKNPIKKDPKK